MRRRGGLSASRFTCKSLDGNPTWYGGEDGLTGDNMNGQEQKTKKAQRRRGRGANKRHPLASSPVAEKNPQSYRSAAAALWAGANLVLSRLWGAAP